MCFYIFGGFNLISLILSLKINYDYVDAKATTKEISNEKHDQEWLILPYYQLYTSSLAFLVTIQSKRWINPNLYIIYNISMLTR